MVNSVTSRPNHYETLGLTPAASEDEIRQAFERKMSECRWHPMGATARICIAYETLSNRIKRADYDRLHGLAPKPQPRMHTMTVTQQQWAPFIASAPTNALGQAALEAAAEPHVTAQADSELGAEPKTGSFIAASLRDLTRPGPRAASDRRPRPQQTPRLSESLEPQVRQMLGAGAGARYSDDRLLDWKKPVLTVGGFVVAAGLIGAFAGLSVRDDEGTAQAALPTAIAAPAVKPQPKAAATSALPLAAQADASADRLFAEPRTRPAVSRRHSPSWARPKQVAESAPVAAPPDATSGDQLVTASPAAQPVAADLPLSETVIARTIDRIGYSCGQVTSTAASQGGGFKVTCSSGQTYDATRVRGRYHFRRSH